MVQTRTQRLREGELCPSLSQGGRGPFHEAACHTELVPWVLRSDQSGAPSRLKRERGSPKPAPALDWKTPQTVSAHQPQCHHVPDNWKGALDQLSWWVQPCGPPGKAKPPRGITGLKKPDSCGLSPVRRWSLPSGCRAVECDSVVASVPRSFRKDGWFVPLVGQEAAALPGGSQHPPPHRAGIGVSPSTHVFVLSPRVAGLILGMSVAVTSRTGRSLGSSDAGAWRWLSR